MIFLEPNIKELPASLNGAAELIDIEEALVTANFILVLVDHKKLFGLKFDSDKIAIDTKGILSAQ